MKTATFKTDADIRKDILDELERDWRFKPAEIGVEVDSGVVTLTGTVSSYPKLQAAADIAAEIAGVKGVANELTVRPIGRLADDTELVGAIRSALRWNPEVPEERIEVIVRNGVVTLKGTVNYWYQREAAAKAAGSVAGVVSVNDHVVTTPRPLEDIAIESDIKKALRRRMPLDADRISVHVNDGTVALGGAVRFYGDRVQAEKVAWMSEGVRQVTNRLVTTW